MVLEIAGTFYKLSGIEIIGHVSFAFAAMSFFVRDMLFLRSFVFLDMPAGSEIQRWLVAIYGHSGN